MAKSNGEVRNYDLLAAGAGEIAVAGETTVYSYTYICPKNTSFGFEFKFRSGGNVRATVQIEQGNTAPATEATSDANFVVPEGPGYVPFLAAGITDELVHMVPHAPVVANFLRVKITGTTGNHATTVLERLIVSTIVNL